MNKMKAKKSEIRVVELFAGVGGFRIGLEGYNGKSASSGYKSNFTTPYKVIWANQWEPSTKRQHAFEVYSEKFKEGTHSNANICEVPTNDIPEHDLLVGGFPCQDYSVAASLKNSGGIEGKKGVLWWEIHRILQELDGKKPKYLILENVDRLLKSPAAQRGRDFAIMLATLNDLGYAVEWKVVDASEYGFPQRRKRTFIVGYHKSSSVYQLFGQSNSNEWINNNSILSDAFPSTKINALEFKLNGSIKEISNNFEATEKQIFKNSGFINDRRVTTYDSINTYAEKQMSLRDILQEDIPEEFYINMEDLDKWIYLKGKKQIIRVDKSGYKYNFSEGSMTFPDDINKASRTIITGEGGGSPSRFKHIIEDPRTNKLRRLTPIELERLNMFPDNHTFGNNITYQKRAFFMGNALVIGVIEKIGISLAKKINYAQLQPKQS